METTTIIKKQDKLFETIRNQNNLLLGFIIIFVGILFSTREVSKQYLFSYSLILLSFILSIYTFYRSISLLSPDISKNKKEIKSLKILILFSICLLLSAIVLFFYNSLWGLM